MTWRKVAENFASSFFDYNLSGDGKLVPPAFIPLAQGIVQEVEVYSFFRARYIPILALVAQAQLLLIIKHRRGIK